MAETEVRSSAIGKLALENYRSRNYVLLLFFVVVCLVLAVFAWQSGGSARAVYISVAASLGATVGYSFAHVILTESAQGEYNQRRINEAVEEAVGRVAETLPGIVAASLEESIGRVDIPRLVVENVTAATGEVIVAKSEAQREFIPRQVYEATSDPNPEFNSDLSGSLNSSSRYTFKGVTGRMAAARLMNVDQKCREVHLIVSHPLYPAAFDARVGHVVSYAERGSVGHNQARAKLVNQIYEAFIGAQLSAGRFETLTIDFTSETQVNRLEIFDEQIYVTLFHESTDLGVRYPRTLAFDKDSVVYETSIAETGRIRNNAAYSVRLTPDTTDDELIEHIRNLGQPNFGQGMLDQLRESFTADAKEFLNEIAD